MSTPSRPPLKANLKSSVEEARAFVASLKGKSPAEAMGVVAHSKLLRGILLSLAIQCVAVLLLTIPFYLWQPKKVAKAPAPTPAAVNGATRPASPATKAAPAKAEDPLKGVVNTEPAKPEEMKTIQPDKVDALINGLR